VLGALHNCGMKRDIWTTQYFNCPDCGLPYSATMEQHLHKHSGSFRCEVCGTKVHAWSGNFDFFDWKIDQPKSPAFGKRWGDRQAPRDSSVDARDHVGWIIAARDSDDDEFPRRFAVCISGQEDAAAAISQRLPEKNCFAERPMTTEELANLGLRSGEYIEAHPNRPRNETTRQRAV
jgi:hypothetical protein